MKQQSAVPSSHPQRPSQYQGGDKPVPDDNDLTFIRKDTLVTRGDLLVEGSGGEPVNLPLGTSGQVLTSNGTDPVWSAAPSVNYQYPLASGLGDFLFTSDGESISVTLQTT